MTIIEKLFKGKTIEVIPDVTLCACMDGKIVDLKEIEDASFSQGVWGEGFAIEPKVGTIVSPVSGTISDVDEVFGIVSISTEQNIEVLVHAGVQMNLYAKKISSILSELEATATKEVHILEVFAEVGQHVEVGDVIMTMNLDLMRDNEIRVVIPIVVAHDGSFMMQMIEEKGIIEKEKGLVVSGKAVAKLKKKS